LLGDSNVSPSVLANLWKEEEARTKTLEEKMRVLLKDKEVSQPTALVILTGFQNMMYSIIIIIIIIIIIKLTISSMS